MNWESVDNDEDGDDLSMGASHSSYLPYCYFEHHRGRIVEYAVINFDGDPYVLGERGLSGGVGTQGWVDLWVLDVQIINFFNTTVNKIKYYPPDFNGINLASTVAGSLPLFFGCFCSNENGTSIPTGGALGESSNAYDELSSLGWNSSGGGNSKEKSGERSWCLLDDWPNAGAGFRGP